MKGRLMTVRLKQIVPIYTESISETIKKRMVHCLRNGEDLSKYLVLEKDPNQKRYYLLSGYVAYEAYKEAGLNAVDCIVKPFSDRTEQMVQLLQNMFHDSRSDWMGKSVFISTLLDQGTSIKEIAKRVGVNAKDLERYLLHPEIPLEIANKAYELNCVPLVDKVRRLCISDILKYRLYERAILDKRNPARLNHDQLRKVKWLLNLTIFHELYEMESQWKYILKMMDYKTVLLSRMQSEIEEELFPWGRGPEDDFPRLTN
ncbi:ParB N-terminal domain-containing protein [Bacillus mobilis]|uniref:ParB N-terminal domain-containing protein n=1 Tax=Bacillus mobilis TaxID=2026190 RepID=UPI0021CF33DB|nr:ParB N-terminal domain-containing protein [Bacillus mobilis]MCU5196829.1 ParB N-terminal domain-containing protein [Bacillus mobilis]